MSAEGERPGDPSASAPRDWDAESYARVAHPQEEWALQVLDRLELQGDEVVLDAGCGPGRVTKLLVERVPRGRVIGVDSSPSMIAKARELLGGEVELIVGDLLELELPEPVDAIFSSATFHWILDHRRLFRRLAGVLAPGGPLEAQCGGIGNVEVFLNTVESVGGDARFGPYLRGIANTWNFASPGDTESRLRWAGFDPVRCWLEQRPVQPRDPRGYLEAVCLGAHLERLPDPLRAPFVDAVLEATPRPLTLDFVRLNISARRG
jgi:trans-aconitate 2-methyltransferase